MRARAIALIAAAAIGAGACGDDEGDTASTPATPAAPATTTETTTETGTTSNPAKPGRLEISKDLASKPEIPKPAGDPPAKLVIQDVVKGRGKTVRLDDTVTVHYVGVSYSTGAEFDASWNNAGQPVEFQLSQGQLIDGWIEGIPGMKVGGRRVLIIPPDLAYGPNGQPPSIGPNETLTFVIDLKKVA